MLFERHFFSFDIFENLLCNPKTNIDLNLIKELNFEEAIAIASNDLYQNLNKENSIDRLILQKYLIRASTRCTPFGLFSGVSKGKLSEENNLVLSDYKKKSMVDIQWLYKIIKKVELEIGSNLKVKFNNSIIYNTQTLENVWHTFYVENENLNGKTIINNTKAISKIKLICKNQFISINEIIEKLQETYTSLSYEYLYKFMMTLLSREFIVSDLRPNLLITNQFEFLLKKIKQYNLNSQLTSQLFNINELLNEYNTVSSINDVHNYFKIIQSMKDVSNAKNYMSMDMYQDSTIEFKSNKVDVIEELAEFLVSWGIKRNYKNFANKFVARYDYQMVKYIDLIDEQYGLGIPVIDIKEEADKKEKIRNVLLSFLLNHDTSNLDISTIGKGNEEISEKIDFEIAVIPFYDESIKYLLSPVMGSKDKNKITGRFRYLFEDMHFDNDEDKYDPIDVEVVFQSFSSKHANIQKTFPNDKYVLEYGCQTDCPDFKYINLEDIYVFLDSDNRIRFVDYKTKKLLHFHVSNAYNPIYYPPIIKPLLDISENQNNEIFSILNEMKVLIQNLDHCPRISYKNVILFPETWKIDKTFYNSNNDMLTYAEFEKNFKQFIKLNNVPDIINIGSVDKKIYINIHNNSHLRIMYNLIKKEKIGTFSESAIIGDKLIVKNKIGKKYFAEFVFNLTSNYNLIKSHYRDIPSITYSHELQHTYFPFEKWISLKLYMKKSTMDKFIREDIFKLENDMINLDLLDKFFYIRFIDDNREHIRLRIKYQKNKEIESLRFVSKFLQRLKNELKINDCIIDSYKQEYERYGGNELITYAESLFMYDSITCMEILKAKKNNIIKLELFDVYIISCAKLLEDMGIELHDQIEYLSDFRMDKKEDKEFRRYKSLNFLQTIIDSNFIEGKKYVDTIQLSLFLDERSLSANRYWQMLQKNNLPNERKRNALWSMLHMHFNRLIGINRQQENLALSYLRKILYIKKQKINNFK